MHVKRAVVAVSMTMIAAMFAVVGVASPASAAACEFEVPESPGECLTEHLFDVVTQMRTDRDAARIDASSQRAETYSLRTQMWALAAEKQQAQQQASLAQSALAIAYDQIDYLSHRVTVQRAKLKELRRVLRDVVG